MKIYLNNREFVLAPFDSSILFLISVSQISQTVWSPHTVERTLQDSCLPFLRSACTMARLVYNINLPEVEVRPSPIVGVKTNAGRESFMTSVSSPLEKRKGNQSRNASCSYFRGRYWACAGQLLANSFSCPYQQSQKSLQKLTRPSFLVYSKVENRLERVQRGEWGAAFFLLLPNKP